MRVALVCLAILALATAQNEKKDNRILGGTGTTISEYQFSAALLYSARQSTFLQAYGGVILNQRSVLTVARFFIEEFNDHIVGRWRVRVGSSYGNSGGTIHGIFQIIKHDYDPDNFLDNDIAVLRLSSFINYIPGIVAPAGIAGENYTVADNTPLWAIGWGPTEMQGLNEEQLRHVQVLTVNQEVCKERFSLIGWRLTENMFCTGWIDIGGRDHCGDFGSPVVHNNVVVGIHAFTNGCGLPLFPAANVRLSRYVTWIRANA